MKPSKRLNWRFHLATLALLLMPGALAWQLAHLQVLPGQDKGFQFLQNQGDARTQRLAQIDAYRGVITDRHGELLAVSTPLQSIFADPQILDREKIPQIAQTLQLDEQALRKKLDRFANKQFMYLARHLPPNDEQVQLAASVRGVELVEEYQRFYPAGEVTSHILGFTDIDDNGQEGMELALQDWLSGKPGSRRVVKDLKGNVVRDLGLLKASQPGKDVRLSIDLRLQYLAYRELKAAVQQQGAISGSIIVLDVHSGEILAMANQPSYNPNDRAMIRPAQWRNRAITDQFEPGSTMKPFTVMAALETGRYHPRTVINTSPGYIRVDGKTLLDSRDYGELDLTTIIAKSSQVGITKLALDLDPLAVRDLFYRVGLGQSTGVGFPGENVGLLPNHSHWRPIERATFAFGHGLTVTALQLAQAYSVIAADGEYSPLSLLQRTEAAERTRIVSAAVATKVRNMLKAVALPGGTATRAQIPEYPVAGKTGTAHKVGREGYAEDRYMALFAGMAPADDPQVVAVVVINEPSNGRYYGGEAAAPVFARVVEGALRSLNVPPLQMAVNNKKTRSIYGTQG